MCAVYLSGSAALPCLGQGGGSAVPGAAFDRRGCAGHGWRSAASPGGCGRWESPKPALMAQTGHLRGLCSPQARGDPAVWGVVAESLLRAEGWGLTAQTHLCLAKLGGDRPGKRNNEKRSCRWDNAFIRIFIRIFYQDFVRAISPLLSCLRCESSSRGGVGTSPRCRDIPSGFSSPLLGRN